MVQYMHICTAIKLIAFYIFRIYILSYCCMLSRALREAVSPSIRNCFSIHLFIVLFFLLLFVAVSHLSHIFCTLHCGRIVYINRTLKTVVN